MGQNVSRKLIGSHLVEGNPTSRQILENLAQTGLLGNLIQAGGRIHQAGCNGCIGMGQAPATGRISLRTVPRNFPGRSGTKDDVLSLPDIRAAIQQGLQVKVINKTKGEAYIAEHALTGRQAEMILSGSLLNLMRKR